MKISRYAGAGATTATVEFLFFAAAQRLFLNPSNLRIKKKRVIEFFG